MNQELQELLRTPREDLDIELKQWMDPEDKSVQAKFAKELLALRNHGGGYLVVGFLDEHPPSEDPARPENLSAFSTDYFNNIIKKYAEPPFHCNSRVIVHPVSGKEYPIVVVPGGATHPVRCKADSPDMGKSAKINSYYIRRPGPESNTPQSGAEWDELIKRCMLAQKESMLSAIATLMGLNRGSVSAYVPAEPIHPLSELRKFRDEAIAALETLQQTKLPANDAARFPNGRYVLSARIVGQLQNLTQKEMLDRLTRLRRYTGWSPLYVFSRPELAPYPVDERQVECWLGQGEDRDVGHADFWRMSTDGFVTLIRGHQEDGHEAATTGIHPGKGLELTLPAWRIAEFLLRVREYGAAVTEGDFTIQLIVQWEGLEGRQLFSYGNRRWLPEGFEAKVQNYQKEVELTPAEIDVALPTVLNTLVTPLLRHFSFFEPPADFYEGELGALQNRGSL